MFTKPLFKSGDLVKTAPLTWILPSSPNWPGITESRTGVITKLRLVIDGRRTYNVLIDEEMFVIDEDMLYTYETKL